MVALRLCLRERATFSWLGLTISDNDNYRRALISRHYIYSDPPAKEFNISANVARETDNLVTNVRYKSKRRESRKTKNLPQRILDDYGILL